MSRFLLLLLLHPALQACAQYEPEANQVFGVRTLPTVAGDWLVRWQGPASIKLDGNPVEAVAELQIEGSALHRLEVGSLDFVVPARQTDPCSKMKMVVVGDGRAASDGVGPSAYWAGILAEAAILEPDFILHTGDFVKNGKRLDEWQRYLRSLPPWPPIIGVRGNHDRGSLFAELGIGLGEIFALRLGPALLVGLDSEVPAARFQALLDELDRLLSRSTGTWKIVMLHRPIWSQGNHGSDERGFNERLVPILDRNQVDLVLSGHDHNYERFCPSRGVGLNRTCADDGNGTTYIVTGGAATFTNHWPGMSRRVDSATAREDAQASRVFSGSKHFVELDVGPDQLVLTARRTRTGNFRGPGVIDRFVLNRKSDCVP